MPAARIPIVVLVAAPLLTACAGPAPQRLLDDPQVAAPAEAIAGRHELFVATTRARADDPDYGFTGERAATASLAKVEVTVPATHKVGELERPKDGNRDPSKVFRVEAFASYSDHDAFSTALRTDIARRGGRALIFIHGYNTTFDEAVYRTTQIVHDSAYSGTPILFSWASAGRTVDYVYDRDSANAARDTLEAIMLLAARAGARRIDIVAHSMGNLVTMEAFRQLAMTGNRTLGGRLGDVVLASPDIDVDVFKSQMRRYGKPDKPFFVLISHNDRALGASRFIARSRARLGDVEDSQEIADLGLIVVDLSKVRAGDDMNHAKFADNPVLVKLLGDRLREGDGLGTTEAQLSGRVGDLARSLGESAAIVITTPAEVLKIAVGG